jgi:branched-chain amino acid transport system ATP-binding protein
MEKSDRFEVLSTQGLSVHFEGVKAVDEVNLEVLRGRITGLIGPNGAGKSTLFNAVSGFVPLTAGRVLLGDLDISGWSPTRIAKHGLVRTFQDTRIFKNLSVLENVELGAMSSGLHGDHGRQAAFDALELLGIAHRAGELAANVSLGDERRAGIARAIATAPDFLLLDEPAAGLDDEETAELSLTIVSVRDELECGVLLVEHDMSVIFSVCQGIHVMDSGRTIAVGTPEEIRTNPAVIEAYFGRDHS